MSNRVLLWMTGIVLVCMVILLLLNSLPLIWNTKGEKYIKFNDVRGMAVEHQQKPYTLNFKQQNEMVEYLNESIVVGNDVVKNKESSLEISKIIIYRFGTSDLTLTPIAYDNNDNLIYSMPEWNSKGLMKDTSGGAMKHLLEQTYDH